MSLGVSLVTKFNTSLTQVLSRSGSEGISQLFGTPSD